MTLSPQNGRLDYLDAVRAFALLLGIVFHASLSFLPVFIGWAVMDVSTSGWVAAFSLVSHSFRMPLFFLVAGFFSHLTFHRKGGSSFLKSRFVRILIPFAIGWFLLRPLLISGWVMGGESMRGDVNVVDGLLIGLGEFAKLPTGLFVGTHLWFLYYLAMVTVLVVLFRGLVTRYAPVGDALTGTADSVVAWLSRSWLAIPVLAVPTAACLWFMSHWGLDTPDQSLLPHVPIFAIYGGFFLFGWLLHREQERIVEFSRLRPTTIVLCILSIVSAMLLAGFERQPGHAQYVWLKAGFFLSYALMMWSLVAVSVGLFRRFFNRASSVVRYVADASYWLYLVHLPIVVWLQIAFAELPLHWSLKLISISVLTIGLSLLVYDLVIRSTAVGALLNGRRKARALFGSRHAEAVTAAR